MPAVLIPRTSGDPHSDQHIRLLRLAHERAPHCFIETASRLLYDEDRKYRYLFSLGIIQNSWDTRLAVALLAMASDEHLSWQCLDQLQEALLTRGVRGTDEVARSFIPIPLPTEEAPRHRAFAAASALLDLKQA